MRRATTFLLLGGIIGWGGTTGAYITTGNGQKPATLPPAPRAEVASMASGGRSIPIQIASNGMFYVNGMARDTPLRFIVDTGSTYTGFTFEDAERMGLRWADGRPVCFRTANGRSCGVLLVLGRLEVGGIVQENIPVSISPKGKLRNNLLGMSFLGRLGHFGYSREQRTLTLEE